MKAPPPRQLVLSRLSEKWLNARYELRPINQDKSFSVFDRKADAFIPIGAIPDIDAEETWEPEGEE